MFFLLLFFIFSAFLNIAHLLQRSQKVGTSSPFLLSARFYEPEVRLDRSLKKVAEFCCKLRAPPRFCLTFPTELCLRRNRAEHEMCGGHGGQPDGPAPSAFQRERREQVNRAETLARIRVRSWNISSGGATSPLEAGWVRMESRNQAAEAGCSPRV